MQNNYNSGYVYCSVYNNLFLWFTAVMERNSGNPELNKLQNSRCTEPYIFVLSGTTTNTPLAVNGSAILMHIGLFE
jgi:hypothetical protein